jgi:hypothetical protein
MVGSVQGWVHILAVKGIPIPLYDLSELVSKQVDATKNHDYFIKCFLPWRLFKAKSFYLVVSVNKLARRREALCADPDWVIPYLSCYKHGHVKHTALYCGRFFRM